MAATEQMKIGITADAASAINGIKQVNSELTKMGPAADKAGAATGKMGKDFTGLSRVIQDLPFGFTAISNNLTQLVPAAGAAGLAFSALVAGLTFAQTGLANWTRGLTGGKVSIEEITRSIMSMNNEIEDAKNRMDAFASTLEFINKLSKLKLDINFGKGLSTDLLDLQGISVGNRELGQKLRETRDIILDHRNKIQEQFINSLSGEQIGQFDEGLLDESKLTEAQQKLKAALDKSNEDFAKADATLIENRQEQLILHAQIEQQKIDIIEDGNKKAEEARKKAAARAKKQLAEERNNIEDHMKRMREIMITSSSTDFNAGTFLLTRLIDELVANESVFTGVSRKLTEIHLPKAIPIRVNVAPKANVLDKDMIALMEDLEATMSKALQGIGTEAFSTIGDAIAAGITGGSMREAFESLFQFIGSALQDLGKQMIALSPIIAALKVAIKTLNPALLLPAGIGLVAIGGILKNLKPKGFAMGGVVGPGYPNDSFFARLTSGERVLTPSQNKEWERGTFGRANTEPVIIGGRMSMGANELIMLLERVNTHRRLTH